MNGPRGTDGAPQLWGAVLGEAGQAIESVIESMDAGQIAQCPVVAFGDESKAFERVSLLWLRKVMMRWGFPAWAKNAIMALAIPRAVRQTGRRGLGPWRHLKRSIGMGGAASLFIWNLVFDRVVAAMRSAIGACPRGRCTKAHGAVHHTPDSVQVQD